MEKECFENMKIGDLIRYKRPHPRLDGLPSQPVGTIVEFPSARHAKEFQKVRVLTEEGMQDWIMQFCEVISEIN